MKLDELEDLDVLRALAKGMQVYQARLERRLKEVSEELARLRGEASPEQLQLLRTTVAGLLRIAWASVGRLCRPHFLARTRTS
ncbi:MAG TPA: hypothetical protein PLZ20_16435 [Nitrospira sp.]|nr:hypothetical protein [Nitrospira sp.]